MPTALPQLTTPRLLLRTLQMHQAQVLFTLANGPKIADNTANIPSPYTLETAQDFIAGIADKYRTGELLNLGMHVRGTDELVGMVSLRINARHHYGHLGGWVAAHCRNQGYAAEAASAVMDFGFEALGCSAWAASVSRATRSRRGSWKRSACVMKVACARRF